MTTSVFAVARHMGEESNWQLTHLAMQKIIYIAHMVHLGKYDQPLVFGHFEAWDYGPVHPKLYQVLKVFGSKKIPENAFGLSPVVHDKTVLELLDDAVATLSGNTARLVAITHWERGAWAKNYVPGVKGIIIPNEDILQEYRDRESDPQE